MAQETHALIHWINNDNASVVPAKGKIPEEMKSGKVGKLAIKKAGATAAKKYDAKVLLLGTRQECKEELNRWCERRSTQLVDEGDLSEQEDVKSQSQSLLDHDHDLPKSKSVKLQGQGLKLTTENLNLFDTMTLCGQRKGKHGEQINKSREEEKMEEALKPLKPNPFHEEVSPERRSLRKSPSKESTPTKTGLGKFNDPGTSTSEAETWNLADRVDKLEKRLQIVEEKCKVKKNDRKKSKESRPKVEVVDITEFVQPGELCKVMADDEMKMTKELMDMVFTDQEMREGSRTGTTSAKAASGVKRKKLEPRKVSSIYTYVGQKFPKVPTKRLRRSIGTSFAEKCRDVRNSVKIRGTSDSTEYEDDDQTVIIDSDPSPMKTPGKKW